MNLELINKIETIKSENGVLIMNLELINKIETIKSENGVLKVHVKELEEKISILQNTIKKIKVVNQCKKQ